MASDSFTYKGRLLRPTNLMPHINRKELCDNFDAILEKIDKQNIGYVIEDEDKKTLVICPAHWFSYCFDERFDDVAISAVRYALTQDGEFPVSIAEFIRRHLSVSDVRMLSIMKFDIEKALEKMGDVPALKSWDVLLANIDKRLAEYRKADKNDLPG